MLSASISTAFIQTERCTFDKKAKSIYKTCSSVIITIESCTHGASTLSRKNLSGYVGHVNIFSSLFSIACRLVVGLGLGLRLGLDLVSGWLVVMHTYLYYARLLLSHFQEKQTIDNQVTCHA